MKKIVLLTASALLLGACSPIEQLKKPESGYYYQTQKNNNSSLVVPPDLSQPSFQNNKAVDKIITEGSKKRIFIQPEGISIRKNGSYRYLVVEKSPETIWELTQDFLRDVAFNVEKSQPKLGVLETNYLKRKIKVPKEELNFIQSALRSSLKTSYSQPVLDKFIIRVERQQDTTEVYLSIRTLAEINTEETGSDSSDKTWKLQPRDANLENIMLYRLMAYLSGGAVQIPSNNDGISIGSTSVEVKKVGNSVVLTIGANKEEAWRFVGWALDRLAINIEEKDQKEGSFYISTAKDSDKGILSTIFGDSAIQKKFQIFIKQKNHGLSEVSVNILSLNEEDSQIFNEKLLKKIALEISKNK